MDPTKKRKQPDSAFSEDPISGDGAVPNWRAVFSKDLHVENRKKIADAIHQNPHAGEIAVLTAYTTAKNREEELFEEATGEVLFRNSNVSRTLNITTSEPVDLASEMEHLDINSHVQYSQKLNSSGVTVDAEDRPREVLKDASNDYIETVHPSVWEQRQQFRIELTHPQHQPQQQQPPAGFRSDSSMNLPPQQQPQQQQSGPNEHQRIGYSDGNR